MGTAVSFPEGVDVVELVVKVRQFVNEFIPAGVFQEVRGPDFGGQVVPILTDFLDIGEGPAFFHVDRAKFTGPRVDVLEQLTVDSLDVGQVVRPLNGLFQQLNRAGFDQVVFDDVQLLKGPGADQVTQDSCVRVQVSLPALWMVSDFPWLGPQF